ncbi:hypothetical protein K8942_04290 [Candidatus Peribacteria bacterium]|nr:MAG: hypothetical protein K8942_04290 [Candidatus Peribacteria bacterium]
MPSEIPSDESTEAAAFYAARPELTVEHTLVHIGEAYGKAVEAQVRETIRLNNSVPANIDEVMAMVEGACNVVFATHFAGQAAVEKNPIVGEPIDSHHSRELAAA